MAQQYHSDLQQLKQQSEQFQHNIKIQQQCIQNIQQIEHLLQTANGLHNQVQHIVQCLSEAEKIAWQQQTTQTAQQILIRLNTRSQQLEQLEQWHQQRDQTTQQLKTNQLNIENTSSPIAESQVRYASKKYVGKAVNSLSLAAGKISFSIVDDAQRPLPLFRDGQQYYLSGKDGQSYQLKYQNHSNSTFEVVASVDGLDVIDGRAASRSNSGYVLRPQGG
jgi:predicted ribosome quality control (RQC) complex YloA/Tae2 family protein